MGGWPRCHRRSADTQINPVSGTFFHAPPRNSAGAAGMAAVPAARKAGPVPSSPAHCPGRASYLTALSHRRCFSGPACPLRAHVGRPVCPLARVPRLVAIRRGHRPLPGCGHARRPPPSPDASPDLAMIEEKDMYRAQRPLSLRGSPVIAAGAGGQKARPGGQDHRIRALPRPRRAGSRDGHLPGRCAGNCRRTWPVPSPAAIRRGGMAGEARPSASPRQPARGQPGCSASARHGGPAIAFPAARHIARLPGAVPGLARARLPQPVYLACTCDAPLMDLAAKQQASGGFDPALAGLSRLTAGTGTLPAGARSLPGPAEVSARSAKGPWEGGQRSIAGTRRVNAGWLHGLPHPSATP